METALEVSAALVTVTPMFPAPLSDGAKTLTRDGLTYWTQAALPLMCAGAAEGRGQGVAGEVGIGEGGVLGLTFAPDMLIQAPGASLGRIGDAAGRDYRAEAVATWKAEPTVIAA